MTDIAQASNIASNSAAATKFVPDRESLCRRFDGKMHGRMAAAKNETEWKSVLDILLNAHFNKNLRPNVRNRFLRECPHEGLVVMLEIAFLLAEKPTLRVNNTEANELFDWRQMKAMEKAKKKEEWEVILAILSAAEKRSNLRTEVRVHFFQLCWYPDLISRLKKATGIV